ncbi:hypothetical protein E2C01_085008 [Portunus trituberculatus]|uniref:Uncharacterized protein n=1 Tax=Portunus trituberculatus TaxID=210409 RepID=A0A5B7IWU1_PORTR|nr:hypothetical protein [Portunus trituberculatus]
MKGTEGIESIHERVGGERESWLAEGKRACPISLPHSMHVPTSCTNVGHACYRILHHPPASQPPPGSCGRAAGSADGGGREGSFGTLGGGREALAVNKHDSVGKVIAARHPHPAPLTPGYSGGADGEWVVGYGRVACGRIIIYWIILCGVRTEGIAGGWGGEGVSGRAVLDGRAPDKGNA